MNRLQDDVGGPSRDGRGGGLKVLHDFVSALSDLVHRPLDADVVRHALGRLSLAMASQSAGFFLSKHDGLQLLSLGGPGGPDSHQCLETRGPELARRAMEESETLADGSPVGALLGAPVVTAGRVLGALVLARPGEGAAYTEGEREILQTFTEVLGTSLRRETLEAQIADQVKRLERQDFRLFTINHVARVLGSILELDELLRLIPDMVAEIVNVESAIVCLVNDEEGTLHVRSSKVLDPRRKVPEFTVPVSEAFNDWIRALHGQMAPVVAADSGDLQKSMPGLAGELSRNGLLLITPMVYKERLIGLLAVGRKYTGEPYAERDREFLSTLAPLASNAIANAQLYDLAIHDSVTGLYVSHYFRRRVMEELKRSRRYGFPVSVTMFDLDYFKQVNDTYGHLAGDQALRDMGHLLRRSSRRDVDVVARYGGEEFVLLLPETPQDGAVVVAERIRRSVEDFTFCGGRVRITASGGVATFPDDALTYEELLERADIQLYRAKRAGRNRIYASDVEYPAR